MYDLKEGDQGKEWIEILNMSDERVDISAWKLYEQDTNHNLKIIQGNNILGSGEYAVIADNQTEFLTNNPGYAGILFDSSFSLSNTGENISIKNADLIIDQLGYNSEWGAQGDGNSLQKIDSGSDSNNSGNWQQALPTPGAENSFQPGEQIDEQIGDQPDEQTDDNQTDEVAQNLPLTVVINEIAWQGTTASANDEWIEWQGLRVPFSRLYTGSNAVQITFFLFQISFHPVHVFTHLA